MIIVRWSHPSKLSKKCQTALEMSLHRDLQLTTLYKEFQFSRAMFEDSVRCGHSVTIATKENVAMVMSLIKEDLKITVSEIKDSLNLSLGSLDRTLCHCLGVWKCCICWVPQQLTKERRSGRVRCSLHVLQHFDGDKSYQVWDIIMVDKTFSACQYCLETKQQYAVYLFQGESPPVKFKRLRSTSKLMTTVSCAQSGHVASAPLQKRKTVKAKWCMSTFQCKIFEAWSTHHPNAGTSSLVLHHHKAGAHTAATTGLLEQNRPLLATHPIFHRLSPL